MHLIVHELNSYPLKQKVVAPDRNVDIVHVRPHLYKHGSPSGTFAVQIQNSSGRVIATSNYLSYSDISSATYFHGYIRFDLDAHIRPLSTIYIALVSDSYTFSESNYIGWCNAYEFNRYSSNTRDSEFAELDFEIWEKMPYNLIQKRIP